MFFILFNLTRFQVIYMLHLVIKVNEEKQPLHFRVQRNVQQMKQKVRFN